VGVVVATTERFAAGTPTRPTVARADFEDPPTEELDPLPRFGEFA
jgi:hypothetical protein